MNWQIAAQIPLLIAALWFFTSLMVGTAFPTLRNKRICLLIAHPDDEAMFFAPSLLHLTRPSLNNQVVLLCLSSGDADGLGDVRKRELAKSGVQLGLRSAERVVVLDDPSRFPDSMTAEWDVKAIARVLDGYFAAEGAGAGAGKGKGGMTKGKRAKGKGEGDREGGPAPTLIDVLVTFDAGGVSGHANHRALYAGAVAWVRGLMQEHAGWEAPVQLYTLPTTGVVRKYSGVLDAVATILACVGRRKEKGEFPTPLLTVSGFGDYRRAQRAMTTAHESQMRWFRWGWIGVSRYMVINDLVKQKIR